MVNVYSKMIATEFLYRGNRCIHFYTEVMNIINAKSSLSTLEEILSQFTDPKPSFSLNEFEHEIRVNLIELSRESDRTTYLHYLLKIYYDLIAISEQNVRVTKCKEYIDKHLKEIKEAKVEDLTPTGLRFLKYKTLIEESSDLIESLDRFKNTFCKIVNKEFGLTRKNWDQLFCLDDQHFKCPTLNDVKWFFSITIESELLHNADQISNSKLNWTGQKNQLYYVFRHLKEQGLIANTYDEIVEFLHRNVTGFEDHNESTTAREIKKHQLLPKSKRVKIEVEDKIENISSH